jgi:hypothetical protein
MEGSWRNQQLEVLKKCLQIAGIWSFSQIFSFFKFRVEVKQIQLQGLYKVVADVHVHSSHKLVTFPDVQVL